MGSRGAKSGKQSGSGAAQPVAQPSGGGLYDGLYVEGTPTNRQRADEVVQGVRDVLADFGMEDELKGVYFTNVRGGDASMDGVGNLRINNPSLTNGIADSHGYGISDTFYGTGAHEAGHAVVNGLLKSSNVVINGGNPIASPNLERATARSKGKLEKFIIKEATKRFGSNPAISGYGSTHVREKVAEAFSDVYANGNNANPYSKVIVDVLKDINAGRLIPQIKVSRSEMGI